MKPTPLMTPLTRRELDEVILDLGQVDGLMLRGTCHEKAGLRVAYDGGSLMLTCAICNRFVLAIAVKP